jgi:glucose/arabinose dehydrogenase/mono/diheme cytochrome c family protein
MIFKSSLSIGIALQLASVLVLAQQGDKEGHDMAPPPAHWKIPAAPVVSPADAPATFVLEEGFELELVAAEPMLHDPVALAFDGNGRIWVAEMQGYMPDIDGKLEESTYGRISVLEDTDGDGKADKHTVFLEKYLLPRAVALTDADKTLLFADNEQLYEAEILIDEKGGIKAGKVTVVDAEYAEGGNPEHKPNGLVTALDNWVYNAKCDQRYKKVSGVWIKEKTEERGQWGIVQDNYGRLFTNTNSNLISAEEVAPSLSVRNPNFPFRTKITSTIKNQKLWPSRINSGVNRGYMKGTLDERGYLVSPTAASGMAVYRGDQFPKEFAGNLFITEPAGNLVKRAVMTEGENGMRTIRSALEGSEFLTSSDERSRMVHAYTAPDGSLYLVDFYRGILQHSVYMTSYLRAQVVERGLDTPIGLGRIWRVRHREGGAGSGQPRMQDESSLDLVAHLSHANGWWRDTAQRLIIERGEADVVAPALQWIVRGDSDALAKIHAVWTLEGLGRLDTVTLDKALRSSHPRVVAEAIRAAESLVGGAESEKVFELLTLYREAANLHIRRQVAATLGLFGEKAVPLLAEMVKNDEKDLLTGDIAVSGLSGHELALFKALPPTHNLRAPLIETLVRRNDRNELKELAGLLETPKGYGALAKAAVAMRRTEEVKGLLTVLADPATDAKVRAGIVEGMLSGGKDKKFKPMPVKELAAFDAAAKQPGVDAAKLKPLAALFVVGTGEEAVFLATAGHKRQFKEGEVLYQQICMACHQIHGNGQQYLAPPLAGSEWVLESEQQLIAIVVDGVMGPIEVMGKTYTAPEIQPMMPGLRHNADISDEDLAAMMTYVRNAWGNGAAPVSPEAVTRYRQSVGARAPYTAEELKQLK